jgi:hypothetical protein
MQFELILVVLLLHLFWWALEYSAIAPRHGRPMRTHGTVPVTLPTSRLSRTSPDSLQGAIHPLPISKQFQQLGNETNAKRIKGLCARGYQCATASRMEKSEEQPLDSCKEANETPCVHVLQATIFNSQITRSDSAVIRTFMV